MERDGAKMKNATRWMGIKSFMKSKELEQKIIPLLKANADAVTKNMILFTIFLEQRCIDERDNATFFRDEIDSANNFRKLFKNFALDRNIPLTQDHPLPSLQCRKASMDAALVQYFSNMKNHIVMNLKKFFIRYIEFVDGWTHAEAKNYVEICLNPENDYVDPRWPDVDFKNPGSNTMAFIPVFIEWEELLRYRQEELREEHRVSGSQEQFKLPRGLTLFPIIPVKKIQRNMISYDFSAIHELYAQYNKQENALRKSLGQPKVATGQKPKVDPDVSREFFGRFFKLSKVERMNNDGTTKVKFAHHVRTNGVKICVLVSKPRVTKTVRIKFISVNFNEILMTVFILFEVPRDTRTAMRGGIDPGCKVILGINTIEPGTRISKNILLKSKTHFHNTGMFARKNILKKMTGAFEDDLRVQREQLEIVNGPELRQFQLLHLDEKYELYSQNKVLQLNFNKDVLTLRAHDRFVSSIVAKRGVTEIFYGKGWKKGFPIRG